MTGQLQQKFSNEKFDLVGVGAGPANLALAESVLKIRPRTKILILEKGRAAAKRTCPLATNGSCPPCNLCHAVHGVGGAGAYSDGKVSFWPAGSGILELAGSLESTIELNDELLNYYKGLIDKATSATTCSDSSPLDAICRANGVTLKPYDVVHAGSEAVQEFYQEKEELLRGQGVVFAYGANVDRVSPANGGYAVSWSDSKQKYQLDAKVVSLGVGKAAGIWLRETMNQLGVQRTHCDIEVGIRIEMPAEVTAMIAPCHRDAKLKLQVADGTEVRTFCFCHRGFVMAAYYDDMTTVSGFSLRDRSSSNTNFAILNRIPYGDGSDPYIGLLPNIKAQNAQAGGGATIQTLGDFIADRPSLDGAIQSNPLRPTLCSAQPGSVADWMPKQARNNLLEGLDALDKVCPGIKSETNLLYGPVLEKCWDKVTLARMRTTAKNIYVVGDATGYARGLVQASATGMLAASSVVKDIDNA